MKRRLLFLASIILLSVPVLAQQRGDMTIGGKIGVAASGGNLYQYEYYRDATYDDYAESDKYPVDGAVDFGFDIRYGYFVIDNLELSAGLEYQLNAAPQERSDFKDEKYNTLTNLVYFNIGAAYYVNIYDGRLFYTPGFSFGLGGGSIIDQQLKEDDRRYEPLSIPFSFAMNISLGTFEFKATERWGITLDVLSLSYSIVSTKTVETYSDYYNEYGERMNIVNFGFNYGINAGVKYYF